MTFCNSGSLGVALISNGRCNSAFLTLKLSVMSLQILNTTGENYIAKLYSLSLYVSHWETGKYYRAGGAAQPWHFHPNPSQSPAAGEKITPCLSSPPTATATKFSVLKYFNPLRSKIQMESFILWRRNTSTNFVGGGLMSIQIRWIEIPQSSSGFRWRKGEILKYRNTKTRNTSDSSSCLGWLLERSWLLLRN